MQIVDYISNIKTEKRMIRKGYIRYFLPTMGGLIFTQIAPIVDSLCISRALGDVAVSAMSPVYPIIAIYDMFAAMIGIGGGICMSKAGGAGNRERAGRAFTLSVISLAIVSAVLTVLFYIFMDPVLRLLSATPDNIAYAKEYLTVFLSGSFALVFQLAFTYILTNDNNPNLSMAGGIVSAIVNIVIDYVGLFVLHKGIGAAAFGTVFGMFVGCMVFLLHLRKKDRMCHFVWHSNKESTIHFTEIVKPGLPQALSYILVIIQSSQANYILESSLGVSGLGNVAIIYNVQIIAATIILSVTGAAFPMFASYYGEGNKDGIRIIKRISLRFGILIFLPVMGILLVCPKLVTLLFSTKDPVMLATLPSAIRITAVAKSIMLINMVFCAHLQSVDKEETALIANVLQGIMQIVAAFFLTMVIPDNAAWYGMLLSYVITYLYLVVFCGELKGIMSDEPESICFIRGGKVDEGAIGKWYEEARAFLSDGEADRVHEKMLVPFCGHLSRDAGIDGTFFILEKENGDRSAILRYDKNKDKMVEELEGLATGEEDNMYNECICSRLNAVNRMMINFKAKE